MGWLFYKWRMWVILKRDKKKNKGEDDDNDDDTDADATDAGTSKTYTQKIKKLLREPRKMMSWG